MTPDSFQFGNANSLDDWGVRIVAYDVLLPQKRARKRVIPGRHGQYDYGALRWEERPLRIECVLERRIERAELREIAAALSVKSELRLWNEPDKFYVAELYDPSELTDYFDECMREFTLQFVCEPFAYSKEYALQSTSGVMSLRNDGTVESPCVIELTAPGESVSVMAGAQSFSVSGLTAGQLVRGNSEDYTCTVDGENALHLMEGDFIMIPPRSNFTLSADPPCALTLRYRKRWL